MSFQWSFVGDPRDSRLRTLFQVYAALDPVDDFAATLGEQLDAVRSARGLAAGFPSGVGTFSFSGELVPAPEPATCTLLGLGIVGLAALLRAK